MRKSKNRYFYHIFVSPGAITLNVVWMEREFDVYKLSRCMCPSNYNCFWDRARYWSKIVILSYPLHSTPSLGGSRRSSATPFGMEKLEWFGYPMVKKISDISLFVLAQLTNVTDGRTDRHRMPAIAALTQHRTAKTCNIHSLLLRSKIRNPYRWDAQCQQGIAVNLQPYTHLFRARHKVLCSDTQNVQW